jgi:ABC-type Fe3+ transport system permease subunit
VLGVIAGSAATHHLLRKHVWLALAGFLGVLAVGLILAFWLVGFPFRGA